MGGGSGQQCPHIQERTVMGHKVGAPPVRASPKCLDTWASAYTASG